MGREAKAKRERKAAKKAALWANGTPTVVQLDEAQFNGLKAAILEKQLFVQRATETFHKLNGIVGEIMAKVGLDPSLQYKLNAETLTAEVVTE
jgi:phage protein D